ncbi:putative electron transfer flavoprotein, alpha subunit [Peptoanaerobacter stomatis]|uniref:Putative electron transfer flavoprotein, alpha subunit n=1 Tax=Peptoanaerobacter stomatis TaxID=796937 RepID=J6HAU4_9FIRM|nr:electron transfer flavoprotein subunit alpha/FixB family protein [Peptoanaerobacter stomatis]EJU19978.1 putative electron transfer flavoprotein, alpha subunit [Peptoanaerobacter stomatis]NWO25013.1 electron transfer flavoprotein subunit alpha/FixB family protein [Peptostreptococcaceae bacterium oral taxon 081]
MSNTNNLMVYIQCDENTPINASLEALSKGVELGKENNLDVIVVLIGKFDENTEKICKDYGANKIIEAAVEQYNIKSYGEIVTKLVKEYSPKLFLAGTTPVAKDVTAYASSKLDMVSLSNVSDIKMQDDFEFTIALYGGAVLRDASINSDTTKFAILSSGAFKKVLSPVDNVEIIKEDCSEQTKDLLTIIKESVTEISESVNLEEAEIIVACGRGMGTPEGYKLVEDLAKQLGGAIGATRPVTESGLVARTQQVGQSGKIVAPKLYIGCGVSGAVQHLSGILGSDYIVAINKDEDAPIFEVADVGIVGDAMAVIPLFMEEIKKVK